MNKFPAEISAWKNDVARRLVRLRGEVDGIMINLPMISDPEIGMPFTGPLSPMPFQFPQGTQGTGGTPSTAANHCPLCPTALRKYELTVAGITNRGVCMTCGNANGTFSLVAVDGLGGLSGSQGISACGWHSESFPWCVPGARPALRWGMFVGQEPPSFLTQVFVFLCTDVGGGPAIAPRYIYTGCPPSAGSGSGTITLNREINPLNDCQTYPATVTLRGVS